MAVPRDDEIDQQAAGLVRWPVVVASHVDVRQHTDAIFTVRSHDRPPTSGSGSAA